MDLEQESKNIQIDTAMTKDIAELCNQLSDLQKQISTLDDKMKKLKELERKLSEEDIPNKMQQTGVQKLELADGTKIEVKPYYAARIPASRIDEAFGWLREHGHGDMIKNNVQLIFDRGQDEVAKKLVDELTDKGHTVKQAEKVEPMTLKAFVREQIEKGQNVPADLFGVYVANKTKLTTKE